MLNFPFPAQWLFYAVRTNWGSSLFNLTKRQLVCFGIGAAIGVPLFFLLKKPLGTSAASMLMMVVMLPSFLLAMYEKNGQPLEKILKNMIQVCFLRPKQRPYETDNFYAVLERQQKLDKEVYTILHANQAQAGRAKTDRSGHRTGQKAG